MSFLTRTFRHKEVKSLVVKAHMVKFMTRKKDFTPSAGTKFFAYAQVGCRYGRAYLREESEFKERFQPEGYSLSRWVYKHKEAGGYYYGLGDGLYTLCDNMPATSVPKDGSVVWLVQYVSGVSDRLIGQVFFLSSSAMREWYNEVDAAVVNPPVKNESPPDPNPAKVPLEIILTSEVGPGDNRAVMKFANGKEVTVTADDWLMFIRFMRDIIHG